MTTEQIAADTDRLAFHRAVQTEGERSPAQPSMSSSELLDIALNASDVEMRRIAIRTLCINSAIDILRQP